ncbi:hypothetical protein EI94DRAFT_633038 [Lactarius quietus]|nr:hypothetical protein EI94DRAFT_633038 [Lactarius quietus]
MHLQRLLLMVSDGATRASAGCTLGYNQSICHFWSPALGTSSGLFAGCHAMLWSSSIPRQPLTQSSVFSCGWSPQPSARRRPKEPTNSRMVMRLAGANSCGGGAYMSFISPDSHLPQISSHTKGLRAPKRTTVFSIIGSGSEKGPATMIASGHEYLASKWDLRICASWCVRTRSGALVCVVIPPQLRCQTW